MAREEEDYRDDEPQSGGNPLWYAFLIVLVTTPLTILTVLFTRWLHVSQHIRIKHIFMYGLLPLTIVSLIFFDAVFNRFLSSWTTTFPEMLSGDLDPVQGIIAMLGQQANLSILVGGYIGLIYAYLGMKDNPEWENIEWRLSPLALIKRKRNIKVAKMAEYAPHPAAIKNPETDDGIMVGVTRREGDIVTQTWLQTRTHTLITGAPGTGKTETLKNRIRDAARKGEGLVLIDFKASPELARIAYDLAQRYGRKYQHFTMFGDTEKYRGPAPEGPSYYDPIGRGNSTRRKDLVLGMREWSEEHYKKQVGVYLELIFKTMIMNPNPAVGSMDDISSLLDPRHMQERAAQGFQGRPEFQYVMQSIDRLSERSSRDELAALGNVRTLMDEMRHSVAGRFLRKNIKNPEMNIDLLEVARKGRIVVFSLDASEYEDMSKNVAGLIVQDMKTITNQLRDLKDNLNEYNPMQLVFDEFASMGSESVVTLMNKSRDAKIGVTLSVQSINDLKAVSDNFASRCITNCGTFIIHRENDPVAAKEMTAISGTRKGLSVTKNYSKGSLEDRSVNVKEQEEYKISVSQIQSQGPGEAIYISANEMVQSKDKKNAKTSTVLEIQEILEDPSVATNMPPKEVEEEEDTEAYIRYINSQNQEEDPQNLIETLTTELGLTFDNAGPAVPQTPMTPFNQNQSPRPNLTPFANPTKAGAPPRPQIDRFSLPETRKPAGLPPLPKTPPTVAVPPRLPAPPVPQKQNGFPMPKKNLPAPPPFNKPEPKNPDSTKDRFDF